MLLSMINDYEVAVNLFIKHNWQDFGYINFRTYANCIRYNLHENNEYIIRKIFNNLLKLNYIEKINIPHKYIYKFNNPERPQFADPIIIHFD